MLNNNWRNIRQLVGKQQIKSLSTSLDVKDTEISSKDDFKILNLKSVSRGQLSTRHPPRKYEVLRPRCDQMPVDQDWGNVWPGPRSFHPATVPLPVRQGYAKKGAPPAKYANAELMKIPNFLHLTPPVIKRQCEALKQFCTAWPKALLPRNDDDMASLQRHFPIEVCTSDYCHSSPTIRDPMARIVTIKLKLDALRLSRRAKDKFLRLVGDRYDEELDIVTIVTDRCPTRKQNYDYGMYLITAVYHESHNVEPWENLKSEADMEYYIWEKNASKQNIERIFSTSDGSSETIPHINEYSDAVSKLMNAGESDYTVVHYGEAVRKILQIPTLFPTE